MAIRQLELESFRNFGHAMLEFPDEGAILITGSNGQGKTNLLEALFLVTNLRSFRTSDHSAMIGFGKDKSEVSANCIGHSGAPIDISVVLRSSKPLEAFRNGKRVRHQREQIREISSVFFGPDTLELVKGPPQHRRSFLDETLAMVSERYHAIRLSYERALRQRNQLLKQLSGRMDAEGDLTLSVWDQRVALAGEELARARKELVGLLSEPVRSAYDRLCGERAEVTISYELSWKGSLAVALASSHKEDLKFGVTQYGPHRDEMAILLSDQPAREFCSQGEQRSLALSLILAAHQVLNEGFPKEGGARRAQAALLLDDVFSELDPKRSAALVSQLPPGQVFITGAGEVPASFRPAAVVHVHSGVATC
jgi:DNA replication and repair protein RecF